MAKREPEPDMQGFRLRGGVWHILHDPITRKAKSTKCRDARAALRWRVERERLAASPADVRAQTQKTAYWIGKALENKRAAAKNRTISHHTVEYWETKLGHWIRIFGEDQTLAQCTPEAFDHYVTVRRSEPANDGGQVKDVTITRELRGMVMVLKRAKRAKCFAGDLEALIPEDLGTTGKPRERWLPEAEVNALLAAMPHAKWAAFVALAVGFGGRKAECLRASPGDFHWATLKERGDDGVVREVERGFVKVRGTKTEKSDRILPILSCFDALVRAALPHLPIGELNNWSRTFATASARAGIARCSPNDLRRTHTTLLGTRGVKDTEAAELLGHTTVSMARDVYNQASASHLAPVVERVLAAAEPIVIDTSALQNPDSVSRARRKTLRARQDSNLRPSDSKAYAHDEGSSESANSSAEACGSVHERATTGSSEQTKSRQPDGLIAPSDPATLLPLGNGLERRPGRQNCSPVDGQLVPLVTSDGRLVGWSEVTSEDLAADLAPRDGAAPGTEPAGPYADQVGRFSRCLRGAAGARLEVTP